MIYIFDTSTFITLFEYFYTDSFPSLWSKYDELIKQGKIISVREVKNEINKKRSESRLTKWVKNHKKIFFTPEKEELDFVVEIFRVRHFQALIRKKEQLEGTPVADPFVIAKAKVANACVVTEEIEKDNAARIPNICKHFGIECLKLEGFMKRENWKF
ncbi:MAG: DUF4411 family protein [Candidatus Marinimicrobia bacterium]|nr:DUF4411 family protein [Candidatus Neomarinimicrobiota bacterium]MCH7762403.1 DUF4411 family protein [Candidatus Neomarinimicrobiota bacterium]